MSLNRFAGVISNEISTAVNGQRGVLGVIERGVKADQSNRVAEIVVFPGSKVLVVAGAPLRVGDLVNSDSSGHAIPQSSGTKAFGEVIRVYPKTEIGEEDTYVGVLLY